MSTDLTQRQILDYALEGVASLIGLNTDNPNAIGDLVVWRRHAEALDKMIYTETAERSANELDQATGNICVQPLDMTLRDYFAAKAISATFEAPIPCTEHGMFYIAKQAYALADAMVKARKQ